MPTTTPNLGLTLPTPDVDTGWGTTLNTDFTQIDDIFAASGSGTGVGLRIGNGKNLTVAGTIVLGSGDNTANPVGSNIRGPAASSGTSNKTGATLYFSASNGTGSGGSGPIVFQTAPPDTSGVNPNTLRNAFVLYNDGSAAFDRNTDGLVLALQANNGGMTYGEYSSVGYLYNGSTPLVFGTFNNDYLSFVTNNNDRMRLSANGALGFGGANYGTAGQVLTSAGNSAVPAWGDIEALTAYTSESFSTSTEVTFTGIASNAESLQIVFHKVKPSVSNQNILIQLGTGSGGTLAYANTGYDTYSINSASSAATDVTSGFPVKTGVTDAEYTGIITISRMYGDLWDCSYSIVNTGTTKSSIIGGGSKTLSANLTAIKVKLASGGNFTSGNVRLMYLK